MRRVASGWETELTLAVDSVFPTWLLGPDIAAFREAEAPTRLRLIGEALSGTWEALLDRRADLLVGAPGEAQWRWLRGRAAGHGGVRVRGRTGSSVG